MSDWQSVTKKLDGKATATEGATVVADAPTVAAVVDELKTICATRGVGGVFAVENVEHYEVTITPSFGVRAAETPEQVFVAGIGDTVNLGMYICDPANRWAPGDLRAEAPWRLRPGVTVDLINVNTGATIGDPYLAFDRATCRLTYSGTDPELVRLYDVQWRINGILFSPFRLRIQRPTFAYGDSPYENYSGIAGVPHVLPVNAGLGAAMAQRFDATSEDNFVLLTPSTASADRYYVATIGKFKNGLASCYLVGVPGKTKIGKRGDKYTSCIVKRCASVYWKDLDICYAWKLGAEDCTVHVVDRVRVTDLTAGDAIMFDNSTPWLPPDTTQTAFVVNSEFTRCGQSGNKHPVYIHLRDEPLGSRQGADASTHFNNVWSYGNNSAQTVNGNCPQGGCNLKCLSKWMTLRNCKLDQTDNWADPYNGFTSSQITSFHAHQRCVIYNNWLRAFNTTKQNFGQDKLLMFQNRNMADSGHDDPPYFLQDPGLPAIPPYQPRAVNFTVDVAANAIRFANKFSQSRAVTLKSTGALPRPLNSVAVYWLMNQTNAGCRLALTATSQDSIKLLDAGSGTHTMTGEPTKLAFNPTYHGTNTYDEDAVDAPFWADVQATPIDDPANEAAYHKFISHNIFELVQLPLDNQLVASAIFDQGNPPCAPTRQFDPEQNYYSVPRNWVERSLCYLGNNVYVGFQGAGNKVVRWNGSTPPTIGVKYPFCVNPLKPRPDPVVVGGERDFGEPVIDVPLPPWFKI